jgi:hypothetical protein
MTHDEIVEMARQCGWDNTANNMIPLYEFAKLVSQHERRKVQGQLETLGAMYELAAKQRDELMAQQRAQIETLRGKLQ